MEIRQTLEALYKERLRAVSPLHCRGTPVLGISRSSWLARCMAAMRFLTSRLDVALGTFGVFSEAEVGVTSMSPPPTCS